MSICEDKKIILHPDGIDNVKLLYEYKVSTVVINDTVFFKSQSDDICFWLLYGAINKLEIEALQELIKECLNKRSNINKRFTNIIKEVKSVNDIQINAFRYNELMNNVCFLSHYIWKK